MEGVEGGVNVEGVEGRVSVEVQREGLVWSYSDVQWLLL